MKIHAAQLVYTKHNCHIDFFQSIFQYSIFNQLLGEILQTGALHRIQDQEPALRLKSRIRFLEEMKTLHTSVFRGIKSGPFRTREISRNFLCTHFYGNIEIIVNWKILIAAVRMWSKDLQNKGQRWHDFNIFRFKKHCAQTTWSVMTVVYSSIAILAQQSTVACRDTFFELRL